MNYTEAKNRINEDCPLATYPAITDSEVLTVLGDSRIKDTSGYVPDAYINWLPSTAYALGDVVVPSTRNGYYYTVTVAGTSGASDPTWSVTIGATVVDGAVTWQCTGVTYWAGAFDIWYAIALVWEKKAGKVAHMTATNVDGQSFSPQDMHTQFLAMARMARRKRGIRSVKLYSATALRYPRYYYDLLNHRIG